MTLRNIFPLVVFLTVSKANIDIKLKFCRFKCGDQCQDDSGANFSQLSGYYWRDYHGVIPLDAYPVGKPSQYPQTYIAVAYDPSKRGLFTTTIREGLDDVYTVLYGSVNEKSIHIQILCTSEPERLVWLNVTRENLPDIQKKYSFVMGGYHYEDSTTKPFKHFILKTTLCGITYVGAVSKLDSILEYVAIDGTAETTKDYLWLLYEKSGSNGKATKKGTTSFIKHSSKYSIREDSVIPRFYKKLVIGSCSITCTNWDKVGTGDIEKKKMAKVAQTYYWKPLSLYNASEGIPVGKNYADKTTFIGQSYNTFNSYDVGELGNGYITVRAVDVDVHLGTDIHVLSSEQPSKFEWVHTTSPTFFSLDATRMIPGGAFPNGTKIIVGRQIEKQATFPGSIHILGHKPVLFYSFGQSTEFQVLMLKENKIKQ